MTTTASSPPVRSGERHAAPAPASGPARSTVLAAVSGLAVVSVMAYYGGSAQATGLLVPGIAALSALIVTALVVAWWLLAAPLRDTPTGGGPETDAAPTSARAAASLPRLVAAGTVVGGLAFSSGGAWDASWHRTYGVGLVVNDFFWPPHFLIYASMGLTAAFVAVAGVVALRGTGSVRRRLRAMPHIAGVGLMAAYGGASGPSDLVWHKIYGLDISAWSLPHIIIAFSSSMTFLMGVVLVLSTGGVPRWRTLRGAGARDLLAIVMLAIGSVLAMEMVTGDYPGRPLPAGAQPSSAYLRPDAWYPVTMTVFGVLLATLWSRTLRRAGGATAVAVTLLVVQAGLMTWVDGWSWGFAQAYLGFALLLPPAVVTDLWTWRSLSRADDVRRSVLPGGAVTAVVGGTVTLLAVGALTTYPTVTPSLVGWTFVIAVPLGIWAAWAGSLAGGWAAGVTARPGARPAVAVDRRFVAGTLATLLLVAGLVVAYRAVAPPPLTACAESGSLCLLDIPRP